jgi:transposase-like protein
MKGKRYSTEDKICILRDADTGKSMLEVCRDHNPAFFAARKRPYSSQLGIGQKPQHQTIKSTASD